MMFAKFIRIQRMKDRQKNNEPIFFVFATIYFHFLKEPMDLNVFHLCPS